jgi:hypothetical protein
LRDIEVDADENAFSGEGEVLDCFFSHGYWEGRGVSEKKEGRKVRNAPALPALENDLSF